MGGEISRIRPDKHWDPPSFLYYGHWVFLASNRPGRGVDHPPPSSAEVKERVQYTSTPRLGLFVACSRVKCTFTFKRDEVTGHWRRLHNEGLRYLYSLPIVRVIKSRRMRWAGHVAHMGKRRGVCRVLWGNLRERDYLEGLGIDGRIILTLIFK